MIKVLNIFLKLFNRKFEKIRYIDEINLDSISPICSKFVQSGMTQTTIEGIIKKQHFKWEVRKINGFK